MSTGLLMIHHAMPCHVMSCHVMSYYACHATSCHITSHHGITKQYNSGILPVYIGKKDLKKKYTLQVVKWLVYCDVYVAYITLQPDCLSVAMPLLVTAHWQALRGHIASTCLCWYFDTMEHAWTTTSEVRVNLINNIFVTEEEYTSELLNCY